MSVWFGNWLQVQLGINDAHEVGFLRVSISLWRFIEAFGNLAVVSGNFLDFPVARRFFFLGYLSIQLGRVLVVCESLCEVRTRIQFNDSSFLPSLFSSLTCHFVIVGISFHLSITRKIFRTCDIYSLYYTNTCTHPSLPPSLPFPRSIICRRGFLWWIKFGALECFFRLW